MVSIPFIAGQWSLPSQATGCSSSSAGFNPLHCGAVVASVLENDPDLQGIRLGFNPLHCGAVVASARRKAGGKEQKDVSIPFIAGQWSLPLVASAALAVWR